MSTRLLGECEKGKANAHAGRGARFATRRDAGTGIDCPFPDRMGLLFIRYAVRAWTGLGLWCWPEVLADGGFAGCDAFRAQPAGRSKSGGNPHPVVPPAAPRAWPAFAKHGELRFICHRPWPLKHPVEHPVEHPVKDPS